MIRANTKGWIGVDLGTHAVKLAQVERRGTRLRLLGALVVRRTSPWTGGDSDDLEVPASSDEIRAALSLCKGFSGSSAAAVLPMNVCDVRECKVSGKEGSESRLLVRRELDTVYGDTKATREFDFCTVDEQQESKADSKAIVFSVKHDWAFRVASDLSESGLYGQVLDGLPWSIARAVAMANAGKGPHTVAALDWGCGRATFCIVKGGVPRYVRCLRDGEFASVLDAVGSALAIQPEEAQKVLADHGLKDRNAGGVDPLQSVIEDVAAEPLWTLMNELERTLTFLRQQRRQLVPDRLLLFGGGAAIKNVDQFISEKSGMPVANWSLPIQGPDGSGRKPPWALLGPAIALSSLAWARS